ncbi:L-lactate dehydrogenase [Xylogone sp. PMI_703]|nr:L-lactate dehydrogenase [Xylogone sp. PMI_703]
MLSAQEVAKHNGRNSCWVILRGKVYDVTEFLDSHPGGADVILRSGGQDITEEYESIHSSSLVDETLAASLGTIDPATISKIKQQATVVSTQTSENEPILLNLKDFEIAAEQKVTATAWAYFESAADDEFTKARNLKAFRKIALRPRILRNVDNINTATTILGKPSALPIFVSPCGLNKLAHPLGECAITPAVGKDGLIQVISTGASMSPESVIAARRDKSQPVFFQLYVNKDIEKSKALIRRVEKLGFSAIWLTVDSPVVGKRERDERTRAKENVCSSHNGVKTGGIAKSTTGYISSSLNWTDLEWIRKETSLPLVIKGIQTVEDAVLAQKHGVDAIVLSNHGGRSQDSAQPSIFTLLEIRKFAPFLIDDKMEIYIDGGIRRGTDVVKALALGVNAVGLGRPFLHALAVGGESGVRKMIEILQEEIRINMALVGATNVAEIVPEMVNASDISQKLIGSVKL